jgi:hypothetical protein
MTLGGGGGAVPLDNQKSGVGRGGSSLTDMKRGPSLEISGTRGGPGKLWKYTQVY